MKAVTAALVLALLSPTAALAADEPHPGVLDSRIQTIDYDPDQVVGMHTMDCIRERIHHRCTVLSRRKLFPTRVRTRKVRRAGQAARRKK